MSDYDWVNDLLGKPWVNPAEQQPGMQHGFDCLSLVTHIYKERLGIDFRPVNVPALIDAGSNSSVLRALHDVENFNEFLEVQDYLADDYDVVVMCRGKRRNHIGIMIGRSILHSVQSQGVISSRPGRLFSDCGLVIDSIWRHKECLK